MSLLNDKASRLMLRCGATAATDVSGFGLAGHSLEMVRGAGVTFRIAADAVPLLPAVRHLVAEGMVPAGCYRNRDHCAPHMAGNGTEERFLPLFDPQTSGGLLIALAPDNAAEFLHLAAEEGIFAVEIGEVLPRREFLLEFA
jgi:selenide,water dikinase